MRAKRGCGRGRGALTIPQDVPRPDSPGASKPFMDAHTLELLEFDKVRDLLAGYAACSLGKELARAVAPSTDADAVRRDLDLVSEMVLALDLGQSPPFGGLHDVRLTVRRAA